MYRHTDPARSRAADPAPARPAASHLSGGQALDRHTQTQMSARFGHDFSDVRIHTDHHAEESAQALGANAYALGGDIAFGPGQYTPGSPSAERLLAHELTHVVQQSQSGPGDPVRASRKDDSSEREADSLSSQVLSGRSVQVQAVPQAAFARDEDEMGGMGGMFNPTPDLPSLPSLPSMGDIGGAIGGGIANIGSTIGGIGHNVGDFLGDAVGTGASNLGGNIGGVADAVFGSGSVGGQIGGIVGGGVSSIGGVLGGAIHQGAGNYDRNVSGMGANIGGAVAGFGSDLGNFDPSQLVM